MAELWELGVRGAALDVVSAWKEVVLAAGFAAIVWRHRGVPFKATTADWLGLAYFAVVGLWFLLPESWLRGAGGFKNQLYAPRHRPLALVPDFFGRGGRLRAGGARR